MGDMSSAPGRYTIHHVPALSMQKKNTLFGSSDRVGGGSGPAGVDTHLRTCALGTILANTCSLLLVVPDVPSQNRGDRTRMNSTKTDDPSIPSLRRLELGE